MRELQRIPTRERGAKLETETEESSDGPAPFTLTDPAGAATLMDPHVPQQKR